MIPIGVVAGQVLPAGGGGVPGAWNPADVAMSGHTFTFTNTDATVDDIASPHASGSVRSLTSIDASKGKRYVEIVINNFGNTAVLGLAMGFSKPGSTMTSDWNNSGNKNCSVTAGGTRSSYGQANTDTSNGSLANWNTSVNGTVLQLCMEIGVDWMVGVNNGGFTGNPSAPYNEVDAAVFACIGDGNFGVIGDSFELTILTTAATQVYAPPSGYTPWDD